MSTALVEPVGWRELLDLGEHILVQPTMADQRALITGTTSRLVGGEAKLWLVREFAGISVKGRPQGALHSPPSELMEQALQAAGTPVVSDGGGIESGSEVEAGAQLGSSPRVRTGYVSAAAALMTGDVIVGALQVTRQSSDPFNPRDLDMLAGVASHSAIGLIIARRLAVERWRLAQLSLVRTVSAQVASVMDFDELCTRVVDLILNTFGYYYVALFIVEEASGVLSCRAAAGPAEANAGDNDNCPIPEVVVGEGIIGQAASHHSEIVVGDVHRDERYLAVSALPRTHSEMALPLLVGERLLGVLDVQSDITDGFDETDVLVIRALADNVAIALEDRRLYNDLERRAGHLRTVAEVGAAVASILDLDMLLEEVVRLVHKRFGYPYVYLLTVDYSRRWVVFRAGIPPEVAQSEIGCSLDDEKGIIPWVARHGERIVANDVRRDPRFRPSQFAPATTQSELAVPLVFGDSVLGVVDVQSDRVDAFSADDVFLFEALADSIAIAVRNANLYQSERWRRQVTEGLQQVAGLLSSNVGVDAVIEAILNELERTLPSDVAAVWLLSEDRLCLSAAHGYSSVLCTVSLSDEPEGWLQKALDAEEPTVRSPTASPDALAEALAFPSDYSAIAAPLKAGERRLGLLMIAHREPGRYGSASRLMVAAFASYAAVAIENARLYQAAQEQAWISTVMFQVAEATQSLDSVEQVIETVVRLVPMLVGVTRCAVFLQDAEGGDLVPSAVYGLAPSQESLFRHAALGAQDALAARLLAEAETPTVLQDSSSGPGFAAKLLAELGFQRAVLLPLVSHSELLGVMVVDTADPVASEGSTGVSQTLSDEWLAIVQGIGYQTASAVVSIRLREAQQQEAYVTAALLQVAQMVVSLTDLSEILSAVARLTPLLVGVDWCVLLVWDDGEGAFAGASAYGLHRDVTDWLRERRFSPGESPLLDRVRESGGRAALTNGVAVRESDESELLRRIRANSRDREGDDRVVLGVPLAVKGEVLGAMLIEAEDKVSRGQDKRVDIITGIAHQTALAIQNDRLQQEMAKNQNMERDIRLAREIQQGLLPSAMPNLPGWEIAVTYRAAREVGGDFYDFVELPGDRLGLVIADVADKGLPAAIFMVLTRALVHATSQGSLSPGATLTRVNDLLVPDARNGMFVTAAYAIVSWRTGEVTYASAGHNPPLVRRVETNEVERLDGRHGIALGALEDVILHDARASIGYGDYLVLYTDGVTEAYSTSQDAFFGETRFLEAVRSAPAESARMMLESVMCAIDQFVGDMPPSDDLTLLVLHRVDQGPAEEE